MKASIPIDFVFRLTGDPPYLWQDRLLRDWLMRGRAPARIDLPAGFGKTRVMALWLAALACGATLPRRLFYVVGAETGLDAASLEAEQLASKLEHVLEALGEDAPALRARLGLTSNILPVSTTGGALLGNSRWLTDPASAAIIIGTVDQIGSCLLFDGYGVNSDLRPHFAGLLGADAYIIVDDAPLAPAFEALLREVAAQHRPSPIPPILVSAMSATYRASDDVFGLAPEDLEDARLMPRFNGPKRLRLWETPNLAATMVERALELGAAGGRIVVFCDHDEVARAVAASLRSQAERVWSKEAPVAVLTASRRGLERTRDGGTKAFIGGQAGAPGVVPCFLVSTGAGESGLDLDADHMICDLVGWERMMQRLGRVNRGGRPEPAMVDIVWSRPSGSTLQAQEVVSGSALDVLRAPFESPAWPKGPDHRRAAHLGELIRLLRDPAFYALARAATTPGPLRPKLTQPIVQAWAMTSLPTHAGRPRTRPWIGGWTGRRPRTRVVWRQTLPIISGRAPDHALLADFFAQFPPHAMEALETDTDVATLVLRARAADLLKQSRSDDRDSLRKLAAVVLSSRNGVVATLGLLQVALGDAKRLAALISDHTLVLDRRLGGLSAEGELDPRAGRAPPTLDAETPVAKGEQGWASHEAVGRRLRTVGINEPATCGWVRQMGWSFEAANGDGPEREWRIERVRTRPDLDGADYASGNQDLSRHHALAVEAIGRLAADFGLARDETHMLQTAAGVHDAGKARKLWQDAAGAPLDARPLARTTGERAFPALREGYRHEFGSLRDAEVAFARIENEDLRDLARHLVAAHHGHARPVICAFDPEVPPSASKARARDAALRMVRLEARWGAWGLAWWEALLRAADWSASSRLELEAG